MAGVALRKTTAHSSGTIRKAINTATATYASSSRAR
jgi:hypothetical protein